MNAAHHQEHLDHSAPCASRWDGFDCGDLGRTDFGTCDLRTRVIGRMTSEAGLRVVITEESCDDIDLHFVTVDGARVTSLLDDRAAAVTVARWWMAGCPA